ncbi:unnamed protein product, partial [Owenia fusiformis]
YVSSLDPGSPIGFDDPFLTAHTIRMTINISTMPPNIPTTTATEAHPSPSLMKPLLQLKQLRANHLVGSLNILSSSAPFGSNIFFLHILRASSSSYGWNFTIPFIYRCS